MGLKSALIRLLEAERQGQRKRKRGPYGDFHRAGGLPLLHDVPVTTEDIVVDAGGFEGDWSAAMILRFGCRCEIFEPVPQLAARCRERFDRNERVHVRQEALGGIDRVTHFSVDALASSEFPGERGSCGALVIEARVVDAAAVVQDLSARFGEVGCLKLNIEGGEYEVLERLIGSGAVAQCRSILVQHHRQPEDWQERLAAIDAKLRLTHAMTWGFPMTWEKWLRLA